MGLLRLDRMRHSHTQNKFDNDVFAHIADVRCIAYFFPPPNSLVLPVKASADSVRPERTDSFKRLDLATT